MKILKNSNEKENNDIKPLCIMPLQICEFVQFFHETKVISFMTKDNKLIQAIIM